LPGAQLTHDLLAVLAVIAERGQVELRVVEDEAAGLQLVVVAGDTVLINQFASASLIETRSRGSGRGDRTR
jgi:hypothetical protein